MASFSKVGALALLAGSAVAIPSNLHGHMHRHHARQNIVYETDVAVVTNVAVVTEVVTAGAPAATVDAQAPAAYTPEPYVNSAGMVGYGSPPSAAPAYTAPAASSAASPAPASEVPAYGSASSAASPALASEQAYVAPSAYVPAPSPPQYTSAAPAAPQYSSAAPVASSPAPAASPDSSTPSNGNKRGLLFPVPANAATSAGTQIASAFKTYASSFSWVYNWDCQAAGFTLPGVEFVPMFWGDKFASYWHADAQQMIDAGSKWLLGPNEPDMLYNGGGQADMTPQQCKDSWVANMEPFHGKAKLVSPAVTSSQGNANMGLSYMQQFMDLCTECHIDAIALHWYGDASQMDNFQQHIKQAHDQFKQPLWITEFQATGSEDQVADFVASASKWLDTQDYVERYSYFMATTQSGGLLSSPNSLSNIGVKYVKPNSK